LGWHRQPGSGGQFRDIFREGWGGKYREKPENNVFEMKRKMEKAYLIISLLFVCFIPTHLSGQTIEFISNINTPGDPYGIFVSGNYAYIADGDSGLQVVNISDLQNLFIVSSFQTPGISDDIFVSGNYVLMTDAYSGLQLINISDPANPVLSGNYDQGGYGVNGDLFVSGDYAYALDDGLLSIVDFSDPSVPFLAGTYNAIQPSHSVFVIDSILYISFGDCLYPWDCLGGFEIINVSNPSNPVSLLEDPIWWGPLLDIFVSGNLACSAEGGWFGTDFGGFLIFDVTDPSSPFELGYYHLAEQQARSVYVSTDFAFICSDSLLVFDISVPVNPSLITSYPIYARDQYVRDNFIFLAELYTMTILRLTTSRAEENSLETPAKAIIFSAYPNPFNSATNISIDGNLEAVSEIAIYDITGRRIKSFAPVSQITWDGTDNRGTPVSSGIYFVKAIAESFEKSLRITLIK
jgi:hypothetical protein